MTVQKADADSNGDANRNLDDRCPERRRRRRRRLVRHGERLEDKREKSLSEGVKVTELVDENSGGIGISGALGNESRRETIR